MMDAETVITSLIDRSVWEESEILVLQHRTIMKWAVHLLPGHVKYAGPDTNMTYIPQV